MKNFLRYSLLALAVMLYTVSASANKPDGREPHRGRLIPYPSAQLAKERKMERQRFMQPVTLEASSDNVLAGVFTFPFSWLERQVVVRVEGVGMPYELYVNGKRAGGATNGHAATEFNITKLSREDKNRVELRLADGKDVEAIECFDKAVCPTLYVVSQPRVRVRDIFYRTNIANGGIVNVDFGVVMQNLTLGAKSSRLEYELYLNDTTRLSGGRLDVELGMYGVDTMRFGAPAPDSVLWSAESPQRISLRFVNRIAGREAEVYDIPVALREMSFDDKGIVVNGERLSSEWHSMSPLSTTENVEQAYNEGKRQIRFSAGVPSEEVLEWCDANGVYVALTAPINSSKAGASRRKGGNPSNDPKWRKEYAERVVQMIHTTKRHASVVAYYLADDSANGIALYEAYLAAKKISGDRPVIYEDGGNEWNSDIR
jgi:beta-galactosidase